MSSYQGSSFNGVQAHERHSSSTSSPVALRAPQMALSSSVPPGASPSAPNPTTLPITLEALLAHHANAPNPTLAALDQALSERNIFSTQNTQLWKLIEKQRSGYNQVLKELERMRVERDTYKARLHAANIELGRKEKERFRPLRPSLSSNAMSTASESSYTDPRAESIRQQAEIPDIAPVSRHDHRPVTPPQEVQPVNDQDFDAPHSDEPPVLSPVKVPPRTASLPFRSIATIPATLPTSSSEFLPHLDEIDRANTSHGPPVPAALQDSAVLHFGPSQQLTAASSSLSIDGNAGLGTHSQFQPVQPPMIQVNTSVTPHTPALSPDSTSRPVQSTNAHAPHPASLIPHIPAGLDSGMLSPVPETAKKISRDSRVSLPDEAKRYIASMTDSPMPSPSLHSERSQIYAGSSANSPERSSPSKIDHAGAGRGADESEFLDLDDEEGEENDRQQQPPPVIHRNARPTDVDDFPLPPSHGHAQSSRESPAPEATSPPQMPWAPKPELLSQPQSSQEPQSSPPQPDSPTPESYLSPTRPSYGVASSPTYHALPLIPDDLRTTRVTVSHSSIKPNDRGKEVLCFEIRVDPGRGKESWKVEKLYSDVLVLDQRYRATVGKSLSKRIVSLPEGKLWRDHAPARSDQRKAALELYLQSLIELPIKNKDDVIAFLTSDIVRDTQKPIMQAGYKEGYLTKRGKNFGGWKTRYFVLQGPVLEYYESRGGAHLGSITITNAQIGRQQRTADNDDEKNYRHAFLIIEAKKGPGGSNPRHVLCAESDLERDSWVDILVRYVTGSFNDESPASVSSVSAGPSPISVNVPPVQGPGSGQPRSSISSNQETVMTPNGKRGIRVMSKDDISRGAAIPLSQLPQDANNAKLFHAAPLPGSVSFDESYSASPTKSVYTVNTDQDQSFADHGEPPLSTSLPTTSPLDADAQGLVAYRPNSEMGHYAEMERRGAYPKQEQGTPESARSQQPRRDRKSFHPGLAVVSGSPTMPTFPDHTPSPDSASLPPYLADLNGKTKIFGPMSGVPVPTGYKFGGRDPSEGTTTLSSDRREKAKSRSFWNFGKPVDKLPAAAPRAVFAVALEESLEVAEIARLPAVVFRCIQYLEAKKAEQEEGIYRLSGSSAVIKGLRDRFNLEGDVNLLASDEYWDPHAIAGLLKSFLRELPVSILTRDLHMRFLSVMDFVEPQERIRELSHLIASLPIANYSLLRALTAHLILIVQNSPINKMTMRNVGIVFSPTLGIPAGVFSLMLGEFNRVFNVDAANEMVDAEEDKEGELSRRNSRQYSDAAADKLLGLSGRRLHSTADEAQSEDGDSVSLQYESGNETTENEATVESAHTRSSGPSQHHLQPHADFLSPSRAETTLTDSRSRAANVAASRGLNLAINSKKGNRQSRMIGLPTSPRPPMDPPRSPVPSPLHTARQS